MTTHRPLLTSVQQRLISVDMAVEQKSTSAPLQVRRMSLDFRGVPRVWLDGDLVATHVVNAVNLLFPDGERFFVRSVAYHLDRITDPALRAQVKAFAGQEAEHCNAHEAYFATLEAQGL